ncbi:MAG: hypothetical protein J0I06_17160 [Planctomycetes bacterium]|nr:hypothetical protein [Planctomycetota bacterium]
MKLLRHFVIAAAVGLALAAGAGTASAGEKPCIGCGLGGKPPLAPGTLFQGGGIHKPKLPAFQAAPWYLYWPYDGHFMTPAPVSGPFYGPPLTGNFPVNPYFPGPAGAVGFGSAGYGFGHGIPGGAAPVPGLMPAPGAPGVPPAPNR